jgi:hypothetical protein
MGLIGEVLPWWRMGGDRGTKDVESWFGPSARENVWNIPSFFILWFSD